MRCGRTRRSRASFPPPARRLANFAARAAPHRSGKLVVLPNRRSLEQRAPLGRASSGPTVSLWILPLFVRFAFTDDGLESLQLRWGQQRADLGATPGANGVHLRFDRLEERIELPVAVI